MKDVTRPEHLWWLSTRMYRRGWKRSARLIKFINYRVNFAVLPCECEVSRSVSFLHRGLGVVVHPNTTVAENVSIGHGVTLAAGSNDPDSPHRVIIEQGAVIGAQAMVIGRRHQAIRLGRSCIVGGGAVVTRDVDDGAVVVGPAASRLDIAPGGRGGE